MFEVGQKVKAIFTQPLPGNGIAPILKAGATYDIKNICLDSAGKQHIDVGLDLDVSSISSFATGEELPAGKRWCHPNRFVQI